MAIFHYLRTFVLILLKCIQSTQLKRTTDVIRKSKCLLLQIANVMDISRFYYVSYYRISKKNKCQIKRYKFLSCFYRV